MVPYLPVIKLATQIVASAGVSRVVSGIVKNNIQTLTKVDTILVKVGTFALSSIAIDKTMQNLEQATNDVVDMVAKVKSNVEKETEE